MTITLYDCATAPSPRRTRILLAEKGLEPTVVQVDLANQEQLGDAFRAINPRCTVPALLIEEEGAEPAVLTENTAIALYVEALAPEPPLLGRGPLEQAQVIEWNARIETEGLMAVAEVLRNGSPRMKGRALTGPQDIEQIPELAERGKQRLHFFFDTLNERLEGREFVASETFSFADITAYVVVDFARWVKQKPGEQHTNLARWFEATAARPSADA